jgi:hypothetical protein
MAKKLTAAAAARELLRRRSADVERLGQWLHDFMWDAMPRIVKLEERVRILEGAHSQPQKPVAKPADAPTGRRH